MLCKREAKQFFQFSRIICFIVLLYTSVHLSIALSVPTADYSATTMLMENLTNSSINDDLYVVKAVVYEIGILTDSDNTTDNTTERQEEVKLSFYNPVDTNNGS